MEMDLPAGLEFRRKLALPAVLSLDTPIRGRDEEAELVSLE